MENTPLDSQTATQSADNTSTVDAAAKATETPKNTEATQSKGKGLPAFLVLGLISLVAAVVLALTNLLTRGPIEEHAQKALREAFSKVLSAQSYEPIDVDASYGISSLYAAKDGDTVKGYTVTAVEKGYAGDVAVTLGVDTEGIITGIVVGDNNFSETAGFGAKAQLPAFTDQFTGLDGINGASFEAVSGATITSTAVLKAANKALAAVAEAALHRTAVSPALAFGAPAPKAATATANADGSISASAAGFGGDVTVTLTTDASGAVASLTVDTPDETPGLGSKASEEEFTKQFIGKAAPFILGDNVDAISGATITSEAVVKAINAALGAEPAEEAAATATANADGSISASAAGFGGDVTVTVTTDASGAVASLTVDTPDETPGLGSKASDEDFTKQFVGKTAPFAVGDNVDAISGATITSEAVVKAINDALASAAKTEEKAATETESKSEETPAVEATAKTEETAMEGALTASAAGFGGAVTVTVTTDESGAVASLIVDTPDETPGLGSKASDEDFTKQFVGKTAPFAVGDNVDAISGATITSEAVVKAINDALASAAKTEEKAATETESKSEETPAVEATAKSEETATEDALTASAAGFGGDVTVTVTTDASGAVASLTVDTPDETPGLGSKASDEDFTKQFVGKTAPFSVGDNVDAISGATITSEAVVKAINKALASAPAATSEEKPAAEATAKSQETATEGALTASAAGFGGDVTVTVTTDASGAVASLTVDTPDETPGLGSKASEEEFTKQFMGKTAPFTLGDNVDAISGATITSEAVVKAINEALASAPAPKSEEKTPTETETKSEEKPAAEATAKTEETAMEGALTASAAGFGGDVTVTVTTDASGAVASLTVDTPDETPGLGSKASEEEFTKQFMGKTAPFTLGDNVDAISGATITSEAVVKAINEALASAAKTEEKAATETESKSEEKPAAEATAKTEETVPDTLLPQGYTAVQQGKSSLVRVYFTLGTDGTIQTLTVDASGETPDLGGKTMAEDFTKQFIGKKLPLYDGYSVDTISGATMTSSAVINAVNLAGRHVNTLRSVTTGNTQADDEKLYFEKTIKGFLSPVTVKYTAEEDGTIASLEVDASNETEGLGTKTAEENFTKQFIGKKPPFTLGENVDAVSGATITSQAVVDLLNGNEGLKAAPYHEGPDAVYTFAGARMGKFSDVYVDADFAEDQTLIALHVNATGETPDRGGRTMEEAFLRQFVGKKAPFELGNGVDAVSGATVTSTAVIEAINEAAKGFDPTVPFSTGK